MKDPNGELIRRFSRLLRTRGKLPGRVSKGFAELKKTVPWGWNNICGVSVGKTENGDDCLVISVIAKLAEAKLPKSARIPERLSSRSLDIELPVKVRETGAAPVLHRAAKPGIEIAHALGNRGGTLGFLVRRQGDTSACLLSCSHVLTSADKVRKGKDAIESPFRPMTVGPRVGILLDFSTFDPDDDNEEDFALGQIVDADPDPRIFRINKAPGPPVSWTAETAPAGEKVVHFGSQNPGSEGEIVEAPASIRVDNAPGVAQSVVLTGLVRYDITCGAGDSGGPVVMNTTQREAAGVHVAGVPGSNTGFFYPIAPILARHNLELITS